MIKKNFAIVTRFSIAIIYIKAAYIFLSILNSTLAKCIIKRYWQSARLIII